MVRYLFISSIIFTRFGLLISMLIYVFNNENIKYGQELNISADCKYEDDGLSGHNEYDDNVIDHVFCVWYLFDKLLDILKGRVECFALKINFTFPRFKTV